MLNYKSLPNYWHINYQIHPTAREKPKQSQLLFSQNSLQRPKAPPLTTGQHDC